MRNALLLPMLILIALPGCAAFQRQPVALQRAERDALGCGVTAVQHAMEGLSPAVLDALAGDAPDWQAQLHGLEAQGANALLCAVSHALFDALGGDMTAVASLDDAVARRLALADSGAMPLPTPTRRVLARGLQYLRVHLPAAATP